MEYLASLKMYKEGKIWREFERNSQTEIPLSLINDIGVERNCRGDRCVAKVEWPAAPSLSPLTSTVLLVAPSWRTLPSAPPPAATSLPPPPPSFFSGVHRSPPITHTCHLASLHPLKTLNAFLPRFFLSFFLPFSSLLLPFVMKISLSSLLPTAKPSFCPISYLKSRRLLELISPLLMWRKIVTSFSIE